MSALESATTVLGNTCAARAERPVTVNRVHSLPSTAKRSCSLWTSKWIWSFVVTEGGVSWGRMQVSRMRAGMPPQWCSLLPILANWIMQLLQRGLRLELGISLRTPLQMIWGFGGCLGGPDFGSGHDLTVSGFKPCVGSMLRAQSLEPASDSVSPALPLPQSP